MNSHKICNHAICSHYYKFFLRKEIVPETSCKGSVAFAATKFNGILSVSDSWWWVWYGPRNVGFI